MYDPFAVAHRHALEQIRAHSDEVIHRENERLRARVAELEAEREPDDVAPGGAS